MKSINKSLFAVIALFALVVFQSCSDDDESNDPTTATFPSTISFSSITNFEFMMWTNGAEISTAGLSLEDYIDEEDFYDLSAEAYKANGSITFTQDSIFGNDVSGTVAFPYYISNDSIYAVISFVNGTDTISENSFIGIGGPGGVVNNQGYLQYLDTDQNGSSTTSILQSGHFTLGLALDELGLTSVGEIEEGDTLIIVNQDVQFL